MPVGVWIFAVAGRGRKFVGFSTWEVSESNHTTHFSQISRQNHSLTVYSKCSKQPVAQSWVVAKSEGDLAKILQLELWRNDSIVMKLVVKLAVVTRLLK